MPLFNPDKINSLVSELRRAHERLQVIGLADIDSFLNDPDKKDSAKYNFIIGIEAAIDICNHIISQNGYRTPRDYADTFRILYEQGAFEDDFIENLINMAKFRNRLVHIYWNVDDNQLYEYLKKNISDYKKFLESVAIFLNLPV